MSTLKPNGIKLKISNSKIVGKSQNTWILNNAFLNNMWAKEEISRELKEYFELKIKAVYPNLQYTAKASHRRKFVAVNALIRKQERSKINLSFHLKKLEKEEEIKQKKSKQKKIIKIRYVQRNPKH